MRTFKSNEIAIGFTTGASDTEFKAAETAMILFFGGRMTSCSRDDYWVVGSIRHMSAFDRRAFIKYATAEAKKSMPNVQVIGPAA